jgi:glucose/arabinose dehydrogenase
LLVTERRGALKLYSLESGQSLDVTGVPAVEYAGQGGLGDVVLHPDFASNGLVYLSYAESGERAAAGAAVARAKLVQGDGRASLDGLSVIWRQTPKVSGRGHYGHRIAFGPDGFLYISSGERQKFTPAQDMQQNLGKIVRLNDDGTVPSDNPFAERGGVTAQIWSLGHRNPLGLSFDAQGELWNVEMGPMGGDELNHVRRGANYGYPLVSNGSHYGGADIPDHDTRPDLAAPSVWWNPVISPSSLLFYSGEEFPQWRGNAFIGGLSSQSLVRIEFGADGSAREAQRFRMGERIRAVEQGPDDRGVGEPLVAGDEEPGAGAPEDEIRGHRARRDVHAARVDRGGHVGPPPGRGAGQRVRGSRRGPADQESDHGAPPFSVSTHQS